jgi:hypothetical protein
VVVVLSRVVERALSARAACALSARCNCGVVGTPIRTLSIGETLRLSRGTRTVSVGAGILDESVGVVTALSVCWLCVGVGAAAPVPSCEDDESVVVVDEGGAV